MLNQALHLAQTPAILPHLRPDAGGSQVPESEFRRYYAARMLPVARTGLAIWLALAVGISVLDTMLMPRAFVEQAVALRILAVLIPLSAALGASFLFKQRTWLPYLVSSTAFLACASTLAISAVTVGHGTLETHWFIILASLCVYLLLGLTLRQSVSVAWPVFLGYVIMSATTSTTTKGAAYGILFLGFANIIGTVGGFLLERNGRQAFDDKRELLRLARTDGLTGLFSRRAFDQHLRQIWKQAEREHAHIAVIVADIDHFKLYNDCYGHRMGDACIRAVSQVVAAGVNRPLDMVARYGGEEFVIVLYDPTPGYLETFSRSLCQKVIDLNIEHKASETTPVMSLSIGAASTDANGNIKADQLIRQADDALYEAKNRGRNQAVVYRAEWGQQTTAHLASVLL